MEITRQKVKKVSLKDNRLEAIMEVDFKGTDPGGNEIETTDEVVRKSSQVIHADLKIALSALKAHLIIICEQPEAGQVDDIYNAAGYAFDNYEVTGYTIGGSDENEGVTIIGKKLLKTGQVLNLIAPFTKYEDEDGYKYGNALSQEIMGCDHEVLAYLDGKWGIVQQEFGFDEEGSTGDDAQMQVVNQGEEVAA